MYMVMSHACVVYHDARMATNLIINEESELPTATDDDHGRLMMDDHATHLVDLI